MVLQTCEQMIALRGCDYDLRDFAAENHTVATFCMKSCDNCPREGALSCSYYNVQETA